MQPGHIRARQSLTHLGSLVVPDYAERLWWYHEQIARALEGVLRYVRFQGRRGGYARVVISLPPQHGKSLHGIELFPAFALGQDPDLKLIVASNGATLAKRSIGHCRQYMSHEAYKSAYKTRFGRVQEHAGKSMRGHLIEAESSAQFFRTLKPKAEGSQEMTEGWGYYLAQGLGGSITGWGYDIGIMDDLVKNAEQAQSSTHHAKLWDFYTSTFDTRERGEFSAQIYIGTRWTNPDFADELIDYWRAQSAGGKELPIKVLTFPALAAVDGAPENPDDPRESGEGLDDRSRFDKRSQRSTAYYESKRAALMTQKPWVWFGTWQQAPKLAGTKFFQPHEWLTFTEDFNLKLLDKVDFSIDCNLSSTGPSYAVISVTGVLVAGDDANKDAGEHYFLLDEARGHWSYEELEEEFVRLRRKWEIALPGPTLQGSVWVENKALGPTLIKKYSGDYPIVPVPKAKSKIICYKIASPVVAQRRVRVPKGTWGEDPTHPGEPLITDAWVGDKNTIGSWVQELAAYPSKPDDRRDVLAQQIICRHSWLGIHLLGAS